MTRTVAGLLVLLALPVGAYALPPVKVILQKMKEAFEPVRPSIRTMTLTVNNGGQTSILVARQARKQTPAGKRMLTVLLQPSELLGSADLVAEAKQFGEAPVMWIYEPFIRRVRKLITIDGFEHYLGTDFTYADLGFVRVHKHYRLLGAEEHAGTKAYKVEEKLPPGQIYYSRVVLFIAQNTMLPLERDYYDPSGDFWKKEVFDQVSSIDGVPTVLHVRMTDLLSNTSTDLDLTQVKYDVEIPDELFDPSGLPKVIDNPIWQRGAAPR